RSKSRRRPMSPLPTPTNWRKVVGIFAGVGVVVILVVAVVAFSSRSNRPRHMQGPVVGPLVPPMQRVQPFAKGGGFQFPNGQPMPAANWQPYENAEHRFKATFPGMPLQNEQDFVVARM